MYVRARGLVIRSVSYKDADLVLTVLTDAFGRITVSARGAKRKNSLISAASQLFACSDMVLFERQGRYSLSEAQVIEEFTGLRADVKKIALASYFAEVLSESAEGEDDGGEILRLALNCLYALSSGKYGETQVKTAFELKFAALSGYAPDLYSCALCGKELNECRINAKTGEASCLSCGGAGVLLPREALLCARHIEECELKKLLSFSCGGEAGAALSCFSETYLSACLERGFKTLDFYAGIGAMP